GIRVRNVTGVQTCALPISLPMPERGSLVHYFRALINTLSALTLPGLFHGSIGAFSFWLLRQVCVGQGQKNPFCDIAVKRTDTDRSEERRVGKEGRAKSERE